jgi:lipopolysaccharide transport system ATP-binding protein
MSSDAQGLAATPAVPLKTNASAAMISVEHLAKRYTIRHQATGGGNYRRLSEELVGAFQAPFRALASRLRDRTAEAATPNRTTEDFWALRDVSFDVHEGEVIGIIGRNGAGKSTLLKILSRITEPTEGRVRIRGRVASLLEVGTGFHPELTGRENVYLNGAILGMSRVEIRRKFDEIVSFADVEKFLDTPVKRYSSGMYVRLAFAVAAHLEPEILVVDEVLAVGDAEFQRKCLGKMRDVGSHGRTVLFVSHNMAAIQSLCQRAIVLSKGACAFDGPASAAVDHYLSDTRRREGSVEFESATERSGSQAAHFLGVRFEDDTGAAVSTVPMGSPLNIVMTFACREPLSNLFFGVVVSDSLEQRVFRVHTAQSVGAGLPACHKGGRVRCRIPRLMLVPDTYRVTLGIARGTETVDHLVGAATFGVTEADVFGTGRHPTREGGPCFSDSQWEFDVE